MNRTGIWLFIIIFSGIAFFMLYHRKNPKSDIAFPNALSSEKMSLNELSSDLSLKIQDLEQRINRLRQENNQLSILITRQDRQLIIYQDNIKNLENSLDKLRSLYKDLMKLSETILIKGNTVIQLIDLLLKNNKTKQAQLVIEDLKDGVNLENILLYPELTDEAKTIKEAEDPIQKKIIELKRKYLEIEKGFPFID